MWTASRETSHLLAGPLLQVRSLCDDTGSFSLWLMWLNSQTTERSEDSESDPSWNRTRCSWFIYLRHKQTEIKRHWVPKEQNTWRRTRDRGGSTRSWTLDGQNKRSADESRVKIIFSGSEILFLHERPSQSDAKMMECNRVQLLKYWPEAQVLKYWCFNLYFLWLRGKKCSRNPSLKSEFWENKSEYQVYIQISVLKVAKKENSQNSKFNWDDYCVSESECFETKR